MKTIKYFILITVLLNMFIYIYSGTLEDIHKKLNKTTPKQNKQSNNKLFQIKNVKPINISGWDFVDYNGKLSQGYGIEVLFKVNKKDKNIHIPINFCYFFDKQKNLLIKKRATYICPQNKIKPKKIKGQIIVNGKKDNKIIFGYNGGFKYKYAICVLGNNNDVDILSYPKRINIKEFSIDEIDLYKN